MSPDADGSGSQIELRISGRPEAAATIEIFAWAVREIA